MFLLLNANSTEPTDYTERKVVKAVVIDGHGKTLIQGSYLIGGGVEVGETDEEALHREAMEEAGMKIEILKPLGQVIGYRDVLKRKYVTNGYLCKYIETLGPPTTTDPEELKMKLMWEKPAEAIQRFEIEIKNLQAADQTQYEGDAHQSRLYNRQMSLAFLKEAFK